MRYLWHPGGPQGGRQARKGVLGHGMMRVVHTPTYTKLDLSGPQDPSSAHGCPAAPTATPPASANSRLHRQPAGTPWARAWAARGGPYAPRASLPCTSTGEEIGDAYPRPLPARENQNNPTLQPSTAKIKTRLPYRRTVEVSVKLPCTSWKLPCTPLLLPCTSPPKPNAGPRPQGDPFVRLFVQPSAGQEVGQ